eukprot:CAMPEP_0201568810 /NCGR_PEP_ID=MMETSP0190_2-20130828/10091_1 /ASSEMBLY_ACC=CAM_ASM_000263 /TAXON_ID=37353 /ORGANISM="Rosalina sp." /LENGTH=181 /DNA_ID=CAMNT_0047990377 /DNA_START=327 /DNA_END=869 /DNA_ORIENTATION=+
MPDVDKYGYCGADNTCNYVLLQTPAEDCDTTPDTYAILPVLTDACVPGVLGNSYGWVCNGDSVDFEYRTSDSLTTCSADNEQVRAVDINGCRAEDILDPGNPLSWKLTSGCISIDYTKTPTTDPTADPTMEPTTAEPTTAEPTEPTMEPTVTSYAPTTAEPTTAPEPDNASFINIVTNYIF